MSGVRRDAPATRARRPVAAQAVPPRIARASTAVLAVLAGLVALGALGGCATDQDIRRHAMAAHGRVVERARSLVHDESVQAYFDRLTGEIVRTARERRAAEGGIPEKDLWLYDRFEAVVVIDPDVNAYVAGDDTVVLNSGLVTKCDHPEEVVSVLCHEFAHIEERHIKSSLQHAQQQAVLQGAMSVSRFVPGTWGLVARAALAGSDMLSRGLYESFSRHEELCADDLGLDLYVRMGYDPAYVKRYFERVLHLYGETGGTTHPRTRDRIARVDVLVPASTAAPRALDVEDFRDIQRRVAREHIGFRGRSVMETGAGEGWIGCFERR